MAFISKEKLKKHINVHPYREMIKFTLIIMKGNILFLLNYLNSVTTDETGSSRETSVSNGKEMLLRVTVCGKYLF